MRKLLGVLVLTAAGIPVWSQTAPPASIETYRRLFTQVNALQDPAEPVLLNGRISRLRFPALQETIGLPDVEAQILKNIAAQCEAELQSLDRAGSVVTLNARLDAVGARTQAETSSAEFAALARKRNEVVRSSVERLGKELGATGLQAVERFLSAGPPDRTFFPLLAR